MATTEKITVEIVLDDGSIQKGFATLNRQAAETAKGVGAGFKQAFDGDIVGGFGTAVRGLAAPLAVATAAAVALKKTLDFSLEGEKINALNKQFDFLAAREGLVGEKLKAGLEAAADGLIDTEDLLVKANGAIAILGANAAKLPEILTLATQSAALLGGTAKERFDQIVTAVESGNQKLLKNAGIVIDTEKVYKEYAKTLGIAASELNQNQRQAALLDAALKEGQQTFKGVTNEVTPLANSLTRVRVAAGEFFDSLALAANRNFGGIFKSAADEVAKLIINLTPAQPPADTIKSVTKEIEALKKNLEDINKAKGGFFGLFDSDNVAISENLNKAIEEKIKLLDALKNKRIEVAATPDPNALTPEQQAAVAQAANQRDLSISSTVLGNQQSELGFRVQDEAAARGETGFGGEFERQQILSDQLFAQAEEERLKKLQAEISFNNDLAINAEQRERVLLSIEAEGKAKSLDISRKAAMQEAAIQKSKLQFTAGLLGQLATIQEAGGREAFEVGKAAALGQATINGYLAVTEAFKLPWPVNLLAVPIAIATSAANIAKIASSRYGGEGSSSSGISGYNPGAFSGGGGIAGDATSGTPLTQAPVAEMKPQTMIEVNIAGDVLDSDETGLRIVELINRSFDQQGVVVRA